jgi:peptidoglycan/LPS O-acetylase OafA/YrhL
MGILTANSPQTRAPGGASSAVVTTSQVSAPPAKTSYHRIPALDGLRGLAVLMVVVSHITSYHAELLGPPGVAIFFVLSGFLITSLLLTERERFGKVSMPDFYVRRALRLFPALGLIVVLTPLLLWLAHDPRLGGVLPGLLSTVFYVQDFASATGHLGVIPHAWSLSVEEQFYLIWPFLLGLVLLRSRGDKRRIARIVWAATIAFGVWHVVCTLFLSYSWTYYAPDANAVFLLAGCALTVSLRAGHRLHVSRSAAVASLLVIFVVSLVVTRMPHSQWREATLIMFPIELAGIIVVLGAAKVPLMAWGPTRWFGRISYGLYLWNYVLISLLPHGRLLSGKERFGAAVLAVGVSAGSWYLLEAPVLRLKARYQRVAQTPSEIAGTGDGTGDGAGEQAELPVEPERLAPAAVGGRPVERRPVAPGHHVDLQATILPTGLPPSV